jgi:hypothetical protein
VKLTLGKLIKSIETLRVSRCMAAEPPPNFQHIVKLHLAGGTMVAEADAMFQSGEMEEREMMTT